MTLTELVIPKALPEAPKLSALAMRRRLAFLGPAFVAAVAYVDPGNFATNFGAGATLGYTLVWVLLLANFMAMEVQYLSAKIGVATGKTLPQMCREAFGRKANAMLWLQAEAVAIATDLAEFVGAALALYLLFGVPMPVAGLITAVVAFLVLACQKRGCRKFELVITASLGLILAGLFYDFFTAGPVSPSGFAGGLVPSFGGAEGLAFAVGIIGATVMPHAIYVHSALSKDHQTAGLYNEGSRDSRLRSLRIDCALGLGVAGLINLSMLLTAAVLFHGQNLDVSSLESVSRGIRATSRWGSSAGLRCCPPCLWLVVFERGYLFGSSRDGRFYWQGDFLVLASRDHNGSRIAGVVRRTTGHRGCWC